MTLEKRASEVFEILSREYPSARCTLDIGTPERFLFTNILSPQCTDEVVNRVMSTMWERYGGFRGLAGTKVEEIEAVIKPCGLQKAKAKSIHGSAEKLVADHAGKLPRSLDELMEFPGIGRKTALVILTEAFGLVEGIIVDTHNIRISNRIGFSESQDASRVEKDLMKIVPKSNWRMWSHVMVFHGRTLCTARNPKCDECPVRDLCDFGVGVHLEV